jgi:hypothetical protein
MLLTSMPYAGQEIEITGYYVCRKPTRTVRGETMYFASFLDRQGAFLRYHSFPSRSSTIPLSGAMAAICSKEKWW